MIEPWTTYTDHKQRQWVVINLDHFAEDKYQADPIRVCLYLVGSYQVTQWVTIEDFQLYESNGLFKLVK